MKTTVWKKGDTIVYIGGDPSKGEPPVITLNIKEPQIQMDEESNIVIIKETK